MANSQLAKSDQQATAKRPVSGADFILLVLLVIVGFGVWIWVERSLTEIFHYQEPIEESFMVSHGVIKQQAELTAAQNEIIEVQKHLNDARVDKLKQNAVVQTLGTVYPQLISVEVPTAAPTEAVKSYQDAKTQAQIASNLIAALEGRLAELTPRADQAVAELQNNKLIATANFREARAWYLLDKRSRTFAITLVIIIFLSFAVRSAVWVLARKRMSTADGFRPFLLAMGALIILFAYDQFNFAGAALFSILFLVLVLRQIKWPKGTDKADVVTK